MGKRSIAMDGSDASVTHINGYDEHSYSETQFSLDENGSSNGTSNDANESSEQGSRKLRKLSHVEYPQSIRQAHLCWMDVQHFIDHADKNVIVQKLAKKMFEKIWEECGEQEATAVLNTFLEHHAYPSFQMTLDDQSQEEDSRTRARDQESLVVSDSESSNGCNTSHFDESQAEDLRCVDEETERDPPSPPLEGTWNLEVHDYKYSIDSDYFTLHIGPNEASLHSLAVQADLVMDGEATSSRVEGQYLAQQGVESTYKGSTNQWEDCRDDFDVMLRVHHDPQSDTIAGEVDVTPHVDQESVGSTRPSAGGSFFFTGMRE